MEAFQLLSRGGVQFNKHRFKTDVELFNKSASRIATNNIIPDGPSQLPSELDFFKYSNLKEGSSKRKMTNSLNRRSLKKARTVNEGSNSKTAEMNSMCGEEPENEMVGSEYHQATQRVTTKGQDVPLPAFSFKDMQERYDIPGHLMANLEKYGFKCPTGVQSHGCAILFESRDMAVISPTGTGKTLSYLLPIMASLRVPIGSNVKCGTGVRAVILAPTRELAHQIHNECLKLAQGRKWRIVLYTKATAATLASKSVQEKVDIIVSTPLRLVAAVKSGYIDLSNTRHLVLDEADRLLDVEFLSQTQEVIAACTHAELQKAVFSATLPANAEKIALDMLHNPIRVVVGLKDTPLPLISQSLTYVADDTSKLPTLITYLKQPFNPPIIIFTSTQPRATSLAEELVLHDIANVDCLHAGLSNKERQDVVCRMQRGESWVLVSTEVMARGMDFKGVREVINYDFPRSVQSYVHRIGRTGRAGREGKAITYFTNEDAPYLKSVANVILQSGSTVPDWIRKLPKPSKIKRKQMGKVKRPEAINPARNVGRNDAIKRREMIAGSKRRKEKSRSQIIQG